MSGVTHEINVRSVEEYFEDIEGNLSDMQPVFEAFGEYIDRETWQRFENQKDPEGNPWEPVNPDYMEVKRIKKILTESSRLKDSLTPEVSTTGLSYGTNVIYAAIHQFGGVIKPVNASALMFKIGDKKIFTKKVTIPARPYLGLNEADKEELTSTIIDYIFGL